MSNKYNRRKVLKQVATTGAVAATGSSISSGSVAADHHDDFRQLPYREEAEKMINRWDELGDVPGIIHEGTIDSDDACYALGGVCTLAWMTGGGGLICASGGTIACTALETLDRAGCGSTLHVYRNHWSPYPLMVIPECANQNYIRIAYELHDKFVGISWGVGYLAGETIEKCAGEVKDEIGLFGLLAQPSINPTNTSSTVPELNNMDSQTKLETDSQVTPASHGIRTDPVDLNCDDAVNALEDVIRDQISEVNPFATTHQEPEPVTVSQPGTLVITPEHAERDPKLANKQNVVVDSAK